jgi:hypothetical protein
MRWWLCFICGWWWSSRKACALCSTFWKLIAQNILPVFYSSVTNKMI